MPETDMLGNIHKRFNKAWMEKEKKDSDLGNESGNVSGSQIIFPQHAVA